MTLTTVRTEVPRDRWGKPLIIPPGGGEPVAYMRASGFDVLEDRYNLERWGERMVALGLADRPDLALSVAAHRDDKRKLDDLCKESKEYARASASATTGTALHTLTEQIDRGQDPAIPQIAAADIAAYRTATAGLDMVDIEVFGVCDEVKAAGTWDRIVEWRGQRFVADLKTGSVDFGQAKMAQQLAIYSHAVRYAPDGTRTETGVYPHAGLIIHLPAGEGTCQLHWIDLRKGWVAVLLSAQVREMRKHKGWMTPFTTS